MLESVPFCLTCVLLNFSNGLMCSIRSLLGQLKMRWGQQQWQDTPDKLMVRSTQELPWAEDFVMFKLNKTLKHEPCGTEKSAFSNKTKP